MWAKRIALGNVNRLKCVWDDSLNIPQKVGKGSSTETLADAEVIGWINAFNVHLVNVKWFTPQILDSEAEGISVKGKMSLDKAKKMSCNTMERPAWNTAGQMAREALTQAGRGHLWSSTQRAVLDTACNFIWDYSRDAVDDGPYDAVGYALAELVRDLDVDTTWLRRWWRAWELGYYPLYEENDTLVVAEILDIDRYAAKADGIWG